MNSIVMQSTNIFSIPCLTKIVKLRVLLNDQMVRLIEITGDIIIC